MRYRLSRTWLMLLSPVLLTACAVLPCTVRAQPQQDQSVADAARRSREQQKNAARQSRVISNDDLDMEYFKPGQEGLNLDAPPRLKTEALSASSVAADEAADQAVTSANKESRPKDKDSEEAAAEDTEIAKLKEQITAAEEDLNWQQRELALDQDTVYSNPNYMDYETGKAKLDSEQQRINEGQQDIEGLKAHLAVLQDRQGSRKQAAQPESAPPPTPAPPQP
jgi:hypothetical protein